jgi:hypothetical protein
LPPVEVWLNLDASCGATPHGVSEPDCRSTPSGVLVHNNGQLELGLIAALRLGGERRGEETARDHAKEGSPIQYAPLAGRIV